MKPANLLTFNETTFRASEVVATKRDFKSYKYILTIIFKSSPPMTFEFDTREQQQQAFSRIWECIELEQT